MRPYSEISFYSRRHVSTCALFTTHPSIFKHPQTGQKKTEKEGRYLERHYPQQGEEKNCSFSSLEPSCYLLLLLLLLLFPVSLIRADLYITGHHRSVTFLYSKGQASAPAGSYNSSSLSSGCGVTQLGVTRWSVTCTNTAAPA